MRRQWALLLAVAGAIVSLLAACDDDERGSARSEGSSTAQAFREARRIETTPVRCEVGKRPGYFVPGSSKGPLALLGCARLGVSGKRVEFSGNPEEIDGELAFCMNPAYGARGERGFYIPALCAFDPIPRLAIRDAPQPREDLPGYGLVIWGTAPASTKVVVAHFRRQSVRAAVFKVAPTLARRLGQPPFSLFVLELPLSAACVGVKVEDQGSGATRKMRRKPGICRRAQTNR